MTTTVGVNPSLTQPHSNSSVHAVLLPRVFDSSIDTDQDGYLSPREYYGDLYALYQNEFENKEDPGFVEKREEL